MSITWNGVSSDTIGVIVERIPNRYVPTRRFSPQQVAGRNGNILLVDKSFPNVEQEYEVYLSAEAQGLPSVARACAEWLMGPDGYCRLEDSYDTTVYREAFLMGGYDLENILNKFGRCTITFSCKPQKYLLTGDTPIEIPAGITTYTGDVVQFDGVTGASITSLSTTITPIQDLHGYANPWPGGGGKQLLNPSMFSVGQSAGVTSSVNSDGTITLNGTATSAAYIDVMPYKPLSDYGFIEPNVSYTLSGHAGNSVYVIFGVYGSGTDYRAGTDAGVVMTFTESQIASLRYRLVIYIANGTNVDGVVVKPMICKTASSEPAVFAPYSNICPISGRTGLSVYRTGKNLATANSGNNKVVGKVKKGVTYTFSVHNSGKIGFTLRKRAQSGEAVVSTPTSTDPVISLTFTADEDFNLFLNGYGIGGTFTDNASMYQLEVGSTATTYEPYNGNTYAVDWTSEAGTVYGGTDEVAGGVLTDEWAEIPSYNGETITEPWLSSMDEYTPGATPTTGAQVVYKLATPLTYQLTPQDVGVLVGKNNVWTSSGPVSVTVVAPFVGTVTNPTPFEARPMLEVSGVGEITINGKTIQILESVSDFQIDCESMEAEDNSKIYCMDFPYLEGGENEIAGDGSITALTVTPRWWIL